MVQALAPKALERVGVPPVGCAFLPILYPLAVLFLVYCCSPCAMARRCAVNQCSLSQLLWELGQPGVLLFIHLLPQPFYLGYLGHWLGCCPVLPYPGQGSHQFGNLVPHFHGTLPRVGGHGSPSPYLIMGFFVLFFCLVSSNHQLRICGPGATVKVPYGISVVFADPMEEAVFEVLLDL